jgi:hypothetical protein
MRIKQTGLIAVFLLSLLAIGIFVPTACTSQSSASSPPAQSQPVTNPPENTENTEPTASPPQVSAPGKETTPPAAPASPVSVVIAGYINHGPMQPTVRAIKEVLSKYDGKIDVTWVDLATSQGQSYFQEHGLTAHMNVIINGKYEYKVDGKTVDFQWFEGQQWTEKELDTVLAGLVHS